MVERLCARLSRAMGIAAVAFMVAASPASRAEATTNAVLTKSLAQLGAGTSPIRLMTTEAGYVVKVPLSPREVLEDASLHLETVNSTALIKSRSELSIRLNGQVLAQYPLDPSETKHARDIVLPRALLKPGYNEVWVNAVQHYTYDCEDPASPELWTEVDTQRSSVTAAFSGQRANLQPRLSQLHVAFDRRGWLPKGLSVVTGTETVTEAQAAAAALVVQGLALRMGYRPLSLEVYGASTGAAVQSEPTKFPGLSSYVVKGRDVLLVGRRAELSRYFDTELYQSVASGPFVGVYPANGGDSIILVVTGNTDQEVMTAARAVAQPDYKFSDSAFELVKEQWGFKAPATAVPAEPLAFNEFGFRTTGVRGSKVQPILFEFRAPGDYGARKGDLAAIKLHFSYGAGLRKDSSMVVRLNGQFAVAVPLNVPEGAEFQKYEVQVPAQYVRPGYNTLSFEPVFMPNTGKCERQRDEGMVLTVYEDSTLELSRPTVRARAPDLKRFAAGLWPHDSRVQLYLAQPSAKTVGAALMLMAELAQYNRAPLEVALRYSPFESGHMLVVGAQGALADYVHKVLPLGQYAWSAEGSQAAVLQAVQDQRVITAFVGQDAEQVIAALAVMREKGLWSALDGKASIIDANEGSVTTEPAGEQVEFGAVSQFSNAIGDAKTIAALVGLSVLLFAVAFQRGLRKRALKRAVNTAG